MQSQDLVSDNSSPSNENQGEGVRTDQSTAGNIGTVQESTPTLSTSLPVLHPVANVEQTQSFSSRGDDDTQMEDRDHMDDLSTIVEATSVQVSGPNDTCAPLSNNEQEIPPIGQLEEQLTRLTSHVQQFGQLLDTMDQTTRKRSNDFEQLLERMDKTTSEYSNQFGQLIESFENLLGRLEQQVTPNYSRHESWSGEQSMMSPLESTTSMHTQSSNTATPSADNTVRSTPVQECNLNKTKTPGLVKVQQPEQTSSKSKNLVSSLLKVLQFKCLFPQCTSPQSPTTIFPTKPPSVIVKELTSSTSRPVPFILEPILPSTADNIEIEHVFACQRALSPGGACEFFLCYWNERTMFFNYERRVPPPVQVTRLSFAPRGYIPPDVAALRYDGEWHKISVGSLHYLWKITVQTHGDIVVKDPATGNLGRLHSAGEPNSIASEGEIRVEGSETQQSSDKNVPGNTSSKQKEETVLQEKKQEFLEGKPRDTSQTASIADYGLNDSQLQQMQSLPSLHDSDKGEQSIVSAGPPPAGGSGTEGIGEQQGHTVSDQRDQRLPTDHLPEITMTVPALDSVADDLETSQLPVELPTMPEELSPVSDISARSTETTSSVPPVSEGDVDDSSKQDSDESD